ncbi:hypothetical protein SH661x_000410 [Planctomicrobium sp. SH661]
MILLIVISLVWWMMIRGNSTVTDGLAVSLLAVICSLLIAGSDQREN